MSSKLQYAFGVLLLVCVVVAIVQFSQQQQQVADAVRCQNGLLQLVVARGSASGEERAALRSLALGAEDGFGDDDRSRLQAYKYAIARADAVYQSDGRLDVAQQKCADQK